MGTPTRHGREQLLRRVPPPGGPEHGLALVLAAEESGLPVARALGAERRRADELGVAARHRQVDASQA